MTLVPTLAGVCKENFFFVSQNEINIKKNQIVDFCLTCIYLMTFFRFLFNSCLFIMNTLMYIFTFFFLHGYI
jgi:hypothetical protein